ncbi:beta-N-acetylhexosaminidase [Bacillus sp. REN16]|uniref:beta-N-acetylhexosaminidase n=1 Tax=Bacillus sp. REN16 TaxID=2887296 RepID=UPI001E31460E|nr:beta-N-acetylhexosaminidase [Bacillus sp. REN16]MCC3356352.1 beta-N-acetylhexosaminidase [Bacillus sp. REN16]
MENTTLAKKAGQLLVIGFNGIKVPQEVRDLIHDYHIGAIILFGRNIGTPKEVLALTTDLQREAKRAGYKHPLLICVDQENGVVRRLGEGTTIFPGAMTLGATGNPNHAYNVGVATGKELKALGINWNLAPVLDVNNNPENPVIGVRSFGESAESVSSFGRASMKGMQQAGIATTLKHFPGHGDTNVDSHLDLPVIPHGLARLEEIELKPFKDCIAEGADTIMSAHVYFPSIETEPGVPATISGKVITGLLRKKLKFNGVVTTDCMEMNAILHGIGTEKGAVAALKAGIDYIMISHTLERQVGAIQEILKAVESGELKEEEIDQSIQRINTLKEKYLSWDDLSLDEELDVPETVGSKQHEEIAHEAYKDGVTILKNDGILPLSTNSSRILVVHPDNGTTMQVEDKRYANLSLGEAIKEYEPDADIYQFSSSLNEIEVEEIVEKAGLYDTVIVGTLTITPNSKQITLIEKLIKEKDSIIVIAMRSPYDFGYLPDVPVYMNTYEFTYPALKVAAGAIFGNEEVKGNLPVTVKKRSAGGK